MNGDYNADSSCHRRMREAVVLLLVGLATCVSGVSYLIGRLTTWFVISAGCLYRSVGPR